MNWQPVARKDIRDAVRSGGVLVLTAVFVLLFVGLTLLTVRTGDGDFEDILSTAVGVVTFLLPVVAFGVGYKAILGERRAGTLVLALALPHSRRDLVVGKFVGRAVVLSVPVLLGLVVAGALGVGTGGVGGQSGAYLWFTVLTVLYGLSFLAVALLLSMGNSSRRATLGAVGIYIALVLLWSILVEFLVRVLFRFRSPDVTPDWAVFVQMLSPAVLYTYLLDGIEGIRNNLTGMADPPWFVTSWVALVLLLAWVVVPVAVGYWRFEQVEF
jgi:ABC-2 type transport system permease protein